MMFIFVLPGWEDSVSDSRVLRDAIYRENGLKVSTGMDGVSTNQNNEKDKKGTRRAWTKEEEEVLLNILEEMVAQEFHVDCGYRVVLDMLNTSGFGWNDEKKCVEVDSDEAWQSYVKDRATRKGAETLVDMIENENENNLEAEYEIGEGLSPMSMTKPKSLKLPPLTPLPLSLLSTSLIRFTLTHPYQVKQSSNNYRQPPLLPYIEPAITATIVHLSSNEFERCICKCSMQRRCSNPVAPVVQRSIAHSNPQQQLTHATVQQQQTQATATRTNKPSPTHSRISSHYG
ncbi:hypothetical protein WN943_010206 [Citrus x changshan-huyou]